MEIIAIKEAHRAYINQVIKDKWSGPMVASMGKLLSTKSLPGYICVDDDMIQGFVLYNIEYGSCEIVVMESNRENRGLGTALVNAVIEVARTNGCKRVWLVTTNDNTHAIRFYQRKGFNLKEVHINSMEKLRQLKPEIPLTGNDHIPVMHEFEFEVLI